LKIRQKILIGYFIVLVAFLTTGTIGITSMYKMQRSYADLIGHRVYLLGETKDYLSGFEYEALMMRTYFLTGKDEWAQEYRQQSQKDEESLGDIQTKLSSEDEKYLFDKLSKTVKEYNGSYAEPMMNIRNRSDLSEQQQVDEIARLTLEQKGTVRGVIRQGEEFVSFQQKLLDDAVQTNASWVLNVTTTTTILAITALLLGLAAALYISRVISEPVKRLEMEANRIAEGDLTPRELPAMAGDEVGSLVRSFGKMTNKLHSLAERMQHSADLIANYTSELQANTRNAADTANTTSGRISRLSETMKIMVEGSRAVVEASGRAANNLVSVEETAEKFLHKMENSNAVTVRASEAVKDLEERLQGIGEIIQFITLIADQAHLLAQKAVTEVAYATEGGSAFISLADEIQKRAQEASSAAKGITGLIENVHRHAHQAVSSLEEDHTIVMEGYSSARKASTSIKELLNELQTLGKRVQEVDSATEQIAECIHSVTTAADEQTTLVEGFASVTGILNQVAGELQSTVATLKL